MGVGVVAALMVVTPLSPRGEISFLLDRNKVAVIDERLRVDNALYRGQDDTGRPFSLTAGEAVQRSSLEGIVRMDDMRARILLSEGPAQLLAPGGAYDIDAAAMRVPGAVRMTAADGYSMLLRDVLISLTSKTVVGTGGVSGAIPAGTFSADQLEARVLRELQEGVPGHHVLHHLPGSSRLAPPQEQDAPSACTIPKRLPPKGTS